MRVGHAVGVPREETARRLDTSRDEHVSLACFDRMSCHADRLERGRAVAVDGDTRHVVEAGQHSYDAADVVPGLAGGLTVAHHEIFDLTWIELGDLREKRFHDLCSQIIGSHVLQRTFEGAADGTASGGDDDGFRHGEIISSRNSERPIGSDRVSEASIEGRTRKGPG